METLGIDTPFVPYPAQDDNVAAARKEDPSGTLVPHQQYLGARIVQGLFEAYTRTPDLADEDRERGLKAVASAALYSAKYSWTNGSVVNFRSVTLPMMYSAELNRALVPEERVERTKEMLGRLVVGSKNVYEAMKADDRREAVATGNAFGYLAAETGLWVAAAFDRSIPISSSARLVQHAVKRSALGAMRTANIFALELGLEPTLAYLAETNTKWTMALAQSTHLRTPAMFAAVQKKVLEGGVTA